MDGQQEEFAEQFVDEHNEDPQDALMAQELRQTLKDAILSLRNRRYRVVLLSMYLEQMEESDMARFLEAKVQDVYLWRHRALKKLRNRPDIRQVLEAWREQS